MKIKQILFAALAALTFASCTQEPAPAPSRVSVGTGSITVSALGDTKTVAVTANCDWKAFSDASWVKFAPESGNASTTSINILIEPNTTGSVREALVSVVSLDTQASGDIKIKQSDTATGDSDITSAESLQNFLLNAGSAKEGDEFVISADIDLGGATITGAESFAGILDGQGHKIYNFKIESETNLAGLIKANYGTVKNLVIGSADGKAADNKSVISFAESTPSADAAGVIGMNSGSVENITNFAKVLFNVSTAGDNAACGGIVGRTAAPCTIKDCINRGTVQFDGVLANKASLGGILGYNDQETTVSGCQNYGDVTRATKLAKEFTIGGITGRTDVKMFVDNCKNAGAVSYNCTEAAGSYAHIGGIIGAMYKGAEVTGCVNDAPLSSNLMQVNRFGGICGTMNTGGLIENCTNNGTVTLAQDGANANWQSLGGILGFQEKGSGNIVKNNTNNGAVSMTVENATTHANKINAGGIAGLCALAAEITGNTNNGKVTVVNKVAGEAHAAGICGWLKGAGSLMADNVNKGDVSCATSDNAAAMAGGVVGVLESGITCTGDKNLAAVVCANASSAGSVAGKNLGSLVNSVAGGSLNGTALDNSNFASLAVGSSSTGSVSGLKSSSGEEASTLQADRTEITVAASDTGASFAVTSNIDWTVACDAAWITSYTKSGKGDGTVEIAFDANTSKDAAREATFVLSGSGVPSVNVVLTQAKVLDEAPHCIANAEELALFAEAAKAETPDFSRWQDNAGVINVTADIDASALTCFPVALIPEGVVVDGGNHTITLAISADADRVALFNTVKGTVRNFVTTGTVKTVFTGSTEHMTAALVAYLDGGTVSGCVNSASIEAASAPTATNIYSDVAGVVSNITNGATVTGCKNNGAITVTGGTSTILGGVVAYSRGVAGTTVSIEGCENTSGISVNHTGGNWDYIGGVVGKMGDSSHAFAKYTISGCRNSGKISIVKAPKIRGGGVFGSSGVATDFLVSGCEFSGEIIVSSSDAVDRLLGGVGAGFSEGGATGTTSGCVFSGKILADEAGAGNFYLGGIYGSSAAAVTFDGCKTTAASVIKAGGSIKSVGVILGRTTNANSAVSVKNCKIAGTVNKGEGDIVISDSNIEEWMYKGSATAVAVTLEGNGYNAE